MRFLPPSPSDPLPLSSPPPKAFSFYFFLIVTIASRGAHSYATRTRIAIGRGSKNFKTFLDAETEGKRSADVAIVPKPRATAQPPPNNAPSSRNVGPATGVKAAPQKANPTSQPRHRPKVADDENTVRYSGEASSKENSNEEEVAEEDSDELPLHARLDVKAKPAKPTPRLKCSQCESTFKSNDTLREHFRSTHGRAVLHACPFCGKEFPKPFKVRRHISSIHEKRSLVRSIKLDCDKCQASFQTADALRAHVELRHVKRDGFNASFQTSFRR